MLGDLLSLPVKKANKDTSLGSPKYLFDRKYDQIDKELKKDIKEHEASKKQLILKAAEKYEADGYPLIKICKRITDVLRGEEYNCSASYIRKILPPKYKNPDQMNIAKKQSSQVGATRYRQREIVANKPVREITDEDFAYITLWKAKQAFLHQKGKADWFEGEYNRLKNENEELIKKLAKYGSDASPSPVPIIKEK